jgi:hypothetical protein
MYSPPVEPGEQSKEGGWAVSAASITEFLGSQAAGTVESQKAIPGSFNSDEPARSSRAGRGLAQKK